MITPSTCGSLSKTKIWKDAIGIECNKVHIFWEGHKILQNLHLTFDWNYIGPKVRWRFLKILRAFSEYMNFTKKKFCVLQKKVLSFGLNRTVEVPPNSSAEPNVQSVTRLLVVDTTKMKILLTFFNLQNLFNQYPIMYFLFLHIFTATSNTYTNEVVFQG